MPQDNPRLAANKAQKAAPKNPITRVGDYVKNAAKESKQAISAWNKAFDAQDNAKYGTMPGEPQRKAAIAASIARRQQDEQFGQAAGAILQGRRYDKNGRQVK